MVHIDNTLQQLERRHESAKDQKSIRIPDGQRLKLNPPALSSTGPLRRRPKQPPPKFNLTFADLNDNPQTSQYHIQAEDDDEDLPDVHDLLKAVEASTADTKQLSSSTSNYSNSEIDALIRDVPLDDFEAELADNSCHPGDSDSWQPSDRPATPLRSRKRPRERENEQHTKRSKTRKDTTEGLMPSLPVFQIKKVCLLNVIWNLIPHDFANKAKQSTSVSH